MDRDRGISVRLKLTLSYAGFLMLAGTLLLFAVWMFLLRGRPNDLFVPDPSDFLRALDPRNFGPRVFLPAALMVLGFLLVFGLVGGWILAGRMLAPLTRITAATRTTTTTGSLADRIQLEGRQDEFHELADAFDTMLAGSRDKSPNNSGSPRTPLTNYAHRWRSAKPCSTSPPPTRTATPPNSSTGCGSSTPERSNSPRTCSSSAPRAGSRPAMSSSTCP